LPAPNLVSAELLGDGRTRDLLANLELAITRRLDGMLHGDYQGLVPGHGSEPGEARLYQAGDDVRRIDWNVTARLGSVHTRETVADRELETWVAVDLSPSLEFGTARTTKRQLALVATGAVGFLTARTGNRFGVLVGSGADVQTVPARTGRAHLLGALHNVATRPAPADGSGRTDLGALMTRLGALHRRRGLAVVVSDFLATGWDLDLARLAARHEVLAIEVLDPRELELPDVGVLQIVDPATGRRREIQTSSADLRRRYADAAAAQRQRIAAAVRKAGSDHLVLRTDGDWLGDLVRFVELRRHRAAKLPRRMR
jgi:uncharacterized protein (DUF58 family)